ncbi:MAG TPA: alkaline phosphatase family protein [Candidatus Acidoferrales bacterium]|nr:alkaline phosphatase family protein [Candidatus Acidoferrales bacterium]
MKSQQPLRIVVLIDALGWRCVEGRPFLNDLLPHRQPLRTVLGFSSGAIPAILTGVSPSVNGHWNLFYYDPQGSPFRWLRYLQFLPDAVLDHRITRKVMKELGRRVLGMGPLFECCVSPRLLANFNWVEKRNIYDRGGISGAPSIFDQMAEEDVPYRVYSYHHSTDVEILRQAEQDIRNKEAQFYFLYLSEMDMFLHMHCHEPERIEERLDWYDQALRKVFRAARQVDSEAIFTVISDHGMTPVRDHFDLVKKIDELGFQMPKDYLAVYDSTMARFWFFNEGACQSVTQHLRELKCGHIVPDEELKRLGVFFADRRFGELVFLLQPGWILSESDFNGKGWAPRGMHGYHPDDSYSDAIFLTNAKPRNSMQEIAEVHEFMEHLVGITNTPEESTAR